MRIARDALAGSGSGAPVLTVRQTKFASVRNRALEAAGVAAVGAATVGAAVVAAPVGAVPVGPGEPELELVV